MRLRDYVGSHWAGFKQRRDDGQAMVLVALMLVSLIGFVALAVDAGYLMSQRRGVQAAVDGAAQAADKAYQRNQESDITATALTYAAESGFPADQNTITVTKHETYGGYDKCVEVEIEHDVTEFFIGAIYSGDWEVGARAVACTELVDEPYALIALNPSGTGITGTGGPSALINNGGAMSNSLAVSDFCGTTEFLVADGPLDAYGGIDICNNVTVAYDTIDPTAPQVEDPYLGVSQPDCSLLPVITDPSIINIGPADPVDVPAFSPGYYPNGIRISGKHNITFLPGVYCFGGDLEASSGNSQPLNIQGDDVLFFFEDPAEFDMQGQGVNVDLSGRPTDYENILVFYQREPVCHDGEFRLLGNNVEVDGVFYAPCAEIHLSGNSSFHLTGQVTGGQIVMHGGAQIVIDFTSSVDIAVPKVYLVE